MTPMDGSHSAISAIPALPGTQYSASTLPLFFMATAIACSRPPPPMINTFMLHPFSVFLYLLSKALRRFLFCARFPQPFRNSF